MSRRILGLKDFVEGPYVSDMWFMLFGALFIGVGHFVTVSVGVIMIFAVFYEKLIEMEKVSEERVAAMVTAHFDLGQERNER